MRPGDYPCNNHRGQSRDARRAGLVAHQAFHAFLYKPLLPAQHACLHRARLAHDLAGVDPVGAKKHDLGGPDVLRGFAILPYPLDTLSVRGTLVADYTAASHGRSLLLIPNRTQVLAATTSGCETDIAFGISSSLKCDSSLCGGGSWQSLIRATCGRGFASHMAQLIRRTRLKSAGGSAGASAFVRKIAPLFTSLTSCSSPFQLEPRPCGIYPRRIAWLVIRDRVIAN